MGAGEIEPVTGGYISAEKVIQMPGLPCSPQGVMAASEDSE